MLKFDALNNIIATFIHCVAIYPIFFTLSHSFYCLYYPLILKKHT